MGGKFLLESMHVSRVGMRICTANDDKQGWDKGLDATDGCPKARNSCLAFNIFNRMPQDSKIIFGNTTKLQAFLSLPGIGVWGAGGRRRRGTFLQHTRHTRTHHTVVVVVVVGVWGAGGRRRRGTKAADGRRREARGAGGGDRETQRSCKHFYRFLESVFHILYSFI
jgi:hypothetical protein